jgi:hypothetical protein
VVVLGELTTVWMVNSPDGRRTRHVAASLPSRGDVRRGRDRAGLDKVAL